MPVSSRAAGPGAIAPGRALGPAPPGAPKASRRGSSPASMTSDSDESWICSPPETPTPTTYLSFPMRGRMVPFAQRLEKGGVSSSASSSIGASLDLDQGGPSISKARGRRRSAGPNARYRSPSSDLTDTDTDSEDDGEINQVRDTLIDIPNPPSDSMGDAEGDEVDSVLLPSDNDPLMTPIREKGKRRMLSPTSEDGDDEAEAEGLLRVRDKGKRPMKMARVLSPSPSPDVKMAPSSESMYEVCKGMNKLHAHSTIINMDIEEKSQRTSHSATKRAQFKRSAVINARQVTRQSRGTHFKRGHQACDHRRLTASADPYLALPVFQTLESPLLPALMEKAASLMDVSMTDVAKNNEDSHMESNSSYQALSAAQEKEYLKNISKLSCAKNKDVPFRRQVINLADQTDIKEVQLLRTSKIRACYEPAVPLTKVQLVGLTSDLSNPATGIHRRPRRFEFPERVPSKSTAHLHRTSPSSLLPWWSPRHERNRRRHRQEQQRVINLSAVYVFNKRHREVRPVEFTSCIAGQGYMAAWRHRRKAQAHRREAVQAYNDRTRSGAWRSMIGTWWGYEQVSTLSSKWWLQTSADQLPRVDEVAVEDLLGNDDASMASASPEPSVSKRKRTEREEVDDVLGEVHDRRSRLDDLRAQQLEEYRAVVRQQEAKQEQRRVEDEARRARAAEAVRLRTAEMAERRRAEREARREAERLQVLERIMEERRIAEAGAEAERMAREAEEAERELEAARLLRVPSPAPTESSTVSDPPEYEFPFFPVVMPRPAHLPAPVRAPTRRAAPNSPYEPPAYLPDRYTNRSPPPPPPYNARTDCQTLIAPIFIEDDEEEPESASSLIQTRASSLEPEMVGAFPPLRNTILSPQPIRQSLVDPIRAFESALELEEGADDDEAEALIEGAFDTWEGSNDEEEDVVPGGAVSSVFQRVFGLVWGGGRR